MAKLPTLSQPQRVARSVGFVATCCAMIVVVISCATPSPSSPRTRAMVLADATEATPAAATVESEAPAAPAATPESLMLAARKMGLSHPIAPAESREPAELTKLNASCVACHGDYSAPDNHSMHASGNVRVSCVDCHGGNANVSVPANVRKLDTATFERFKLATHVRPRVGEIWAANGSGNPSAPGARTLNESLDFIRFVNPGDLHVARAACAGCHNNEKYGYVHDRVDKSMMGHGSMLWGAALYNNGSHNRKDAVYGEAYAPTPESIAAGDARLAPAMILSSRDPAKRPTFEEQMRRGWLERLLPLSRWEVTQPGNILRVFERGGERLPNLGSPDAFDPPGKPDVKLSTRGLGTNLRTDPVFIGLQKTRLLDPTLRLFGTNDHAGDYRGSGCTACHVVYANDRSPVHSGPYARFGNAGKRSGDSSDLALDRYGKGNGSGHPVHHVFAAGNNIPSSQCMVCHIHPGTNVVNAYFGFTWWDNEVHAERMYPKEQQRPTGPQVEKVERHNPEGAAPRGLWSNLYPGKKNHKGDVAPADFLTHTGSPEFNAKLDKTQFADFHGHGWVFRAVFKRDRAGNLLDGAGNVVAEVTPGALAQAVAHVDVDGTKPGANGPVHLKDIHLERGMQCVDCHFDSDVHGDGKLYGETRNAVMIACADCHGTATAPAAILQYRREDEKGEDKDEKKMAELKGRLFTGPAAASQSPALAEKAAGRFTLQDGNLVQRAAVATDAEGKPVTWVVRQTHVEKAPEPVAADADEATKAAAARARAALYAHTVRRDNKTWGSVPAADEKDPAMQLAHGGNMSCYACHTSWNTSCFGCHLPMKANKKKDALHNEGHQSRNYTNYNFQTIRDDVYMLGKDGTVASGGDPTKLQTVPIRSACAVLVSSQNANREWIYTQQQTISAEGFAGTAFSPYFPHTVRTRETKQCADCHLSGNDDNNAIMSQLLLLGTKSVNFVGRYAYLGGHEGFAAIAVTERDEPQAVIGSRLHEFAYPDDYKTHVAGGAKLAIAHEKEGYDIRDLQLRGEYLYAAAGKDGFIAFDVANVDNKGFSERIVTAPVSPLGQRLYVRTREATSVCSPSTLAIDPTRPRLPENQEGPIAPLYAYLYVTDAQEGLVVVGNTGDAAKRHGAGVSTLLDGDPTNNFLSRAATFNPGGALRGARHMRLIGNLAYIACDAGLRVVDLTNPLEPRLLDTPGLAGLKNVRKTFFQFRYAFVLDDAGLKVVDVTDAATPRLVEGANVTIDDARDIYVTRTYGYVAAGKGGLVIVDLTKATEPKIVSRFTDGLVDATAVRVGMTNASQYAYVADGVGGLKVLQLTSADDRDGTPTFQGFSPLPKPRLIASKPTRGPATALSEGLDRDRAVDEAGQQLAVFGRRGARPFNLAEMQRLYLRPGDDGRPVPWTVSDQPPGEPTAAEAPKSE